MDNNFDSPIDMDKVGSAINHICDYFDEQGLTLIERWFACESIELAALGIMSEGLREICKDIKDTDLESLKSRTDA